jgi:hypothetical protein
VKERDRSSGSVRKHTVSVKGTHSTAILDDSEASLYNLQRRLVKRGRNPLEKAREWDTDFTPGALSTATVDFCRGDDHFCQGSDREREYCKGCTLGVSIS